MVNYGDLLDTSGAIKNDYLDQIIECINERYQGDFGDKDRVVLESVVKGMTRGNCCESLASSPKTLETSRLTYTKRNWIKTIP